MSDGHENSGPEHKLERLIFFSDAVFAIAITLLVIEIHAPHLHFGASARDYGVALVNTLPSFSGFLLSFFVVGAFWAGHHRAFALAKTWDDRLVRPNFFCLASIAAMPFFTAFMSANPTGRLPALVYCAWMVVAGLFNVALQRIVTAPPVVDPHVSAVEAAAIRRRGKAVVLGSATALLLVMVVPWPTMGLAGLGSIGIWRRVLQGRGDG